MAVLTLRNNGSWILDNFLEPVGFWPTSAVQEIVMSAPRRQFQLVRDDLIQLFQKGNIETDSENKSAFAIKDIIGKIWYIGFYDHRVDIGSGVRRLTDLNYPTNSPKALR